MIERKKEKKKERQTPEAMKNWKWVACTCMYIVYFPMDYSVPPSIYNKGGGMHQWYVIQCICSTMFNQYCCKTVFFLGRRAPWYHLFGGNIGNTSLHHNMWPFSLIQILGSWLSSLPIRIWKLWGCEGSSDFAQRKSGN